MEETVKWGACEVSRQEFENIIRHAAENVYYDHHPLTLRYLYSEIEQDLGPTDGDEEIDYSEEIYGIAEKQYYMCSLRKQAYNND